MVLFVCVLGCEPLDSNAPLLSEHSGGLLSQAALDGDLFESPRSSSGASSDSSATADLALVDGSESSALPAEKGALAAENAPGDELTPVQGQGDELTPAQREGDGQAPAQGEGPSGESEAIAAVQEEPTLPDQSDVEELPTELSSGEYGGGSVVVQQFAVPPSAPAAGTASKELPAEDGATGALQPTERAEPIELGAVARESQQLELVDVVTGTDSVDLASVLPEVPSSDQAALAALDSLPRRSSIESLTQTPPCLSGAEGLLAVPLGQLSMVRAWLDGTLLRAELRGPDGRLYTVVRGDRVGSDGGRVLQVSSTQVVVGEIGFGLDGSPFIVQEAIR